MTTVNTNFMREITHEEFVDQKAASEITLSNLLFFLGQVYPHFNYQNSPSAVAAGKEISTYYGLLTSVIYNTCFGGLNPVVYYRHYNSPTVPEIEIIDVVFIVTRGGLSRYFIGSTVELTIKDDAIINYSTSPTGITEEYIENATALISANNDQIKQRRAELNNTYIKALARLLQDARNDGVELEVSRVPHDPTQPRMGQMSYEIEAWTSRSLGY